MKIKIAKKAGFCMGVRRAVNLVLKALNAGKTPLYTYGPLIHNPQTLELLERLGVKAIKRVDEAVPQGTCIIRAHGVPPKEKEALERRHTVIDGTCPRVLKVQALAKRAVEQGKKVVIIGDKDHAEVKGILGYCEGAGYVVSSYQDIENLPPLQNYVILSQTTQDEEVFNLLSQEILSRYPGGEVINTICNATEVRQSEVRRLSQECPAIVVIGGKFSANTARLAQIAEAEGKKVFLIERAEELPLEELKNFPSLGITAGASTPNWLINEVVDRLKSATQPFYRLFKAFQLLAFNEALSFLFLFLALSLWTSIASIKALISLSAFAFFFQLCRKNLANYLLKESFQTYYPLKGKSLTRHSKLHLALILLSLALTLVSALTFNPRIISLIVAIILLDLLLLRGPIYFINDFLLLLGLVLYLYPYWTEPFLWLTLMAFLLLFWLNLYKELIYLQTDGFLPKNFLILNFPWSEKRWQKVLLLGLILLLFYIGFLSLYLGKWTFIFLAFLLPIKALLLYLLKQRPLGQIMYLESLYLLPTLTFFLISILLIL